MDKSAELTDISCAALVEKRQPKQRDKCRRDQSFSLVEVIAFAELTA
jgi:hypothetical protein